MSITRNGYPQADGFHMPAEYEPHAGCWMLWPHRSDNWRLNAAPAQAAFAAVANNIARYESLSVGVAPNLVEDARRLLAPAIKIVELQADDSWARDVGPTFVSNDSGEIRGVDWRFNAWGGLAEGLYHPWERDDGVAAAILVMAGVDRYRADFVLEGGAIHVDGEGTLITTEECLLNRNRNPALTRADMERRLYQYLGVESIIWLEKGVFNDETDGHVDNLCAFVRPGQVALTWTDDTSDPQHAISSAALRRLSAARDARGRRLEVSLIRQPDPLYMSKAEAADISGGHGTYSRREGLRLAASYINFYIANGAVIAPRFDDLNDDAALTQLALLFPDRDVIGLPAREILLGGGGIHCITQQQPSV